MVRHVAIVEDKPEDAQHEVMSGADEAALTKLGTRGTSTDASNYADSETGMTHRDELKKAERRLLLKQDMVIMPFAVLLYLSAYLDRGNMGNARLIGLQKEALDNSDANYSLALSCFFITYICLSIPGTLLAKAVPPNRSIAAGAFIWSLAATCQAAAQNPASVFVCRLLVGVGEAFFGQAMALHLSYWYTKGDLAKRVGFFISGGSLSGAFGGLIAFGISSIQGSAIEPWRILFLIEGIPGIVLAICVALFLPSRPESSKFLTETQRTVALTRLNRDSTRESGSGIDWKGVRRSLTDWKTYYIAVAYSCMNLTLGSVGGFLPTIIKNFGYTAAQAQLMTVPPYAVALIFMLILTAISDRKRSRGIPVAIVFILGIVGWAILLSIPAAHATTSQYSARYFGCILIVCAGYTNIPLIISWQAGNNPNDSQRATSLGMLLVNVCQSPLHTFEGPQFVKGCAINLAFQGFGLLLAIGATSYFRYENKRRDKIEGGRPPAGEHLEVFEQFDLAKGFRYVA